MNLIIRYLSVCVFFVLGISVYAQNTEKLVIESQKIDFLIKKIETLKNAAFVRNGVSYDAVTAASHLKIKRDKAGKTIKTVNDFIEKVASKSNISGEPYRIVFENGKELLARDYFYQCLKELE